jgi:serine/threonine protein kinase
MRIPVNKASTYMKEWLTKDEAKVLGEGGFGKVFGGTYNGESVAIKTLREKNSSTIQELKNEVRMLQILGSFPGIVRLVTANLNDIDKGDELCLVMEVAKGTLHDVLYNNLLGLSKELPLTQKLLFVSQIADAMNMLFTFQVLYRDLKPANVLIFLFGNQPIAKLTDFGLAKRVGDQSSAVHLKGTIAYIALELFTATSNELIPYSFPAEVYSFGILLNEVMTNSLPYPSELLSSPGIFAVRLEKGLTPTIYAEKKDSLSVGITNLIGECIQRNSSDRPSFAVIVERLKKLLSSPPEIIVSPSTTARKISLSTWDEALSWTFLVQSGCSVDNTKPFIPVTGELLEGVQQITDLEEHVESN